MLTDQQIEDIRNHLRKSKNPLFFFDDDPDGLVSYILLKKNVNRGTGVCVKASPMSEGIYIKKIQEHKPDRIFVLDRPVLSQELINKIKVPIVWIDHHTPLNRENVNYFNPMNDEKPDNRPTSYWCYRVVQENLWIALIGIIGDWYVPEFMDKFEYKELIGDANNPPDILFKSRFGILVKVYSFILKGQSADVKKSIRILTEIESPYEILDQTTERGKYIFKRFERINRDYESLLRTALKTPVDDDIYLFKYPSTKMSFTGALANELLCKIDAKIVIIARQKGNDVRLSLRSNKVPVLPILRNALKGIDGYGGGHCLDPDSLIQLANGDIIKIKDIELKDKTIGMNIEKNNTQIGTVSKKFKIKKHETYLIRASPYSLNCSADHTIFRHRDKIEEVKVKDIRIGDLIVGLKNLNIRGSRQKIPNLNKEKSHILSTYNTYKKIKISRYLDKNFSKIFGYMLGDGNIYDHDIIEIKDYDLELIKYYKDLIKRTFNIDGVIKKIKNKNAFRCRFYSSLLSKLFEKIEGRWPYQKIIPSLIKRAQLDEIIYFLKGIYDAEGSIGDHEINLSQSNDQFLMEIQLLLLRLGILSSKRTNGLFISDYNSIKIFYRKINFTLKRKRLYLKRLLERINKKNRNTRLSYCIINSQQLIKILKSNNFNVRRYFGHPERAITLLNLGKIYKDTGIRDIKKYINTNFALFRVNKIKKIKTKKALYDLTIPKVNNFIANGLLVHNSYACGANVKKNDFDIFIENLKRELKSS